GRDVPSKSCARTPGGPCRRSGGRTAHRRRGAAPSLARRHRGWAPSVRRSRKLFQSKIPESPAPADPACPLRATSDPLVRKYFQGFPLISVSLHPTFFVHAPF